MRPSRPPRRRAPAIDVVIASARWQKAPRAATLVRRAIAAAVPERARAAELSVILTSDLSHSSSFPAIGSPRRIMALAGSNGFAFRHIQSQGWVSDGYIIVLYGFLTVLVVVDVETTVLRQVKLSSRSFRFSVQVL